MKFLRYLFGNLYWKDLIQPDYVKFNYTFYDGEFDLTKDEGALDEVY